MIDRQVQYPNRYRMIPVEGTADIVDLVPAPGEVLEEGTIINKFSLLKDTTALAYGLTGEALPDEVLALLKQLVDTAQAAADYNNACIATGSYVGAVARGKTLTFPFPPKFVFIFDDARTTLNANGGETYPHFGFLTSFCLIYSYSTTAGFEIRVGGSENTAITTSGNSITVENPTNGPVKLLADSTRTHYYVAFGHK